ncbi:hypothetical protein QBC47DRAFT_354831 [Echria macrotheca]|uniref:Protein kinase domain-containing protein n=1 Tax=Echria macrotheca TaxID=438768 RepID=A0AAJ0F003_9PEZI|nr:hypothetical protein QBC47DRAFT_354831 [Echria macrotheca]
MDVPEFPLRSNPESNPDPAREQKRNEISLRFQLGTRRILAKGSICDHHPNVVHLRVLPNCLDWLLWPLLHLLPAPLRDMLRSSWPEWFLPPKVVLKRKKKGWDAEFENEKAIYQQLVPLQGTVVPICYGEADCPATESTETRALVLSDIGGIGLYEDAASGLDTEHVESMLLQSLRALASLGVIHDDSKLDNYRIVGDRIMVIDFDSSYITESGDTESYAKNDAKFATELYWLAHGGTKPKLI